MPTLSSATPPPGPLMRSALGRESSRSWDESEPLPMIPNRVDRWARISLVIALAVALVGKVVEKTTPPEVAFWGGLVFAFGEAALVGGLADWFAVRALFVHPFGIPFPHTAIIP